MDSIISPTNLDIKNVIYGVPRTNDNGGKSIYLSFNKKPIVLQTPEMFAPFGKQKWDNDKGLTKYTLDLSYKGMDTRPALETFYNKMSELDEKLIDDGLSNSFDWLKKKNVSRDVVKELYTKLVRHHIDKTTGEVTDKYPPTFKLTLPWKDGAFACEVYDGNKKIVDLATLETKGARVTAIIQCLGIWVAAGKFGCTWKVLQMRVLPPATIKGYAFKEIESVVEDNEEDDDDDEEDIDPPHTVLKEDNEDDDDDDNNDIVDSTDDELEVKKGIKKVTIKKK